MKKIVSLLLALLMLSSVCAFAEEAAETLYTAEDGTTVTLTMKGEYTLTKGDADEYGTWWTVSREGVADVYICVAPSEEIVGMNDLTDEEIEELVAYYSEGAEDYLTLTVEVTPSGNKYFDFFWDLEGEQCNERWTYFEGFELNRMQFTSEDHPVLTDEDTAFLAEVQEGMWVTFPAAE